MPIWMAFVTLTCIWGSTPLAIQWSQIGLGYPFAVMARMAIGVVLFVLLLPWLVRQPFLSWRALVVVSVVAGLNLFASMWLLYLGAPDVPSGWISVLFGLGPMVTGIFGALWLDEPFPMDKWVGSVFGLIGLLVIFTHGSHAAAYTSSGIGWVLASVVVAAAGNIAIKRFSREISPMWVAAGSMWVAFPLFVIVFLWSRDPWPQEVTMRAGMAILYLGLVANGIGFICFYHLMGRVSVATAYLVTLTAPVVALWLGVLFNAETIQSGLLLGTGLILFGLLLFLGVMPLRRVGAFVKKTQGNDSTV
ncbi:MAG: DMT family transporter [Magnetococcales bacterium]|nr:DMT family transporter [Magnetococcales bacterium]